MSGRGLRPLPNFQGEGSFKEALENMSLGKSEVGLGGWGRGGHLKAMEVHVLKHALKKSPFYGCTITSLSVIFISILSASSFALQFLTDWKGSLNRVYR